LIARPETGPLVPGPLIADIGGGTLMAVFGILAALLARGKSGEGQFVDVSMTDGAMHLMSSHMPEYMFGKREPRGGEQRVAGGSACYNIYRCADGGYFTLGIIEDHFWLRLRTLLGRDELPASPFGPPAETARTKAILAEVFATKSRDEWVKLLWDNDIPAGPVNSFAEACADPQMVARDMVLHVDHPVEGRIPQIGFPVKFSQTPGAITRPPPLLGEHTDEVLAELGYSDADRQALRTSETV